MLFSGSDISDLGEPSDRPSPVSLAVLEVCFILIYLVRIAW